jgi:hypothetical protein
MPGDWRLRGHDLPPGAARVPLTFESTGDRLALTVVVATTDGDFARIGLGLIDAGRQTEMLELPSQAVGGRIVALSFANTSLIGGEYHPGETQRASVRFEGADGVAGSGVHDIEVTGADPEHVIRPAQRADGVVLPALVSRGLGAAPGTELVLRLADGRPLPIRSAAEVEHFPTVIDPAARVAVLPLEPLLAAIDADVPGVTPNEMWIDVPDAERQRSVEEALARPPFRRASVASAAAIETDRVTDPLSRAVVGALLVVATAALLLALAGLSLGAATDLRDDSGELADLEAQGVRPTHLRRHAVARVLALVAGGAAAGIVAGVSLTTVVTGAFAVSADAAQPIPGLRAVLPVVPIAAVAGAVVLGTGAVVRALAGRAFRGRTLGSDRD